MKDSKRSRSLWGILLCVPLAFIVYFAISYSSKNISTDNVKSVSLSVPDGQQFTYTESDQIDIFVKAIVNAKSINSTVRDISKETPATLKYDRGDKIVDYKLYMQHNLSGCIVVDSDDKVYIFDSDTAASLLMRNEFQYIYGDYMLPKLSVVSADSSTSVLPLNYDWHYKKVDGNIYADNTSAHYDKATAKTASIYPKKDSKFNFTVKPDDLAISFTTAKGDNLSVSDLSYLSFDKDTEVEVIITAKWKQSGNSDFYGEATYSFPLLYDLPAAVTLDKKTYNPGDIAVIGIKYLNQGEKVTLDTKLTTPGLTCFTQGDISFALLPISTDNTAGEYTLDFKMNGASYSDKITVNQADFTKSTMSLGDGNSKQTISDDMIKQTDDKLKDIFSKPCQEAYFTFGTAFITPVNSPVYGKFGTKLIIQKDDSMKVLGTVYSAPEGSDVRAAQRGKVVLAESLPTTGITVVIDHGYGIMSCYYNLKSVNVKVGDIVQQDEKFALSGTSGYTAGDAILTYAVSVNGAFVNPDMFATVIRIPQ